MEERRKRRFWRWCISIIAVFVVIVIGGSFYLLSYSLQPNADIRKKNADAWEYMFTTYPFLEPWVDSLNHIGALRDTFIYNPEGIRLHALYIEAAEPTKKTAVIVHGYTDEAIHSLL